MNNTVYDVDFTRALPEPLKNDKKMLALGKAIAGELRESIILARQTIIYPRIDELDEWLLDILAHDLHVDWYDPDSPIELKREIIKDSVRIHKLMGTKPAVERVVTAYFGSGTVRHWYEYGGEPHFFRILTDNPSVTEEREGEFLRILDIVKRKSSWLEQILVTLVTEFDLFFGFTVREFSREAHVIGVRDEFSAYFGATIRHTTRETHTISGVEDPIYKIFGVICREFMRETHEIKGD